MIRDPLGISSEMVLNRESFLLLSLIDGEEKIENIKSKFLRNTGIILSDIEIISFIRKMEKNYIFLDENFYKKIEEEKKKIEEMPFKEIDIRFDFEKVKREIEKIDFKNAQELKGIIVPHIDINVAFDTYLKSYSFIKNLNKKIFLIFGVPHFYSESVFSVFKKNCKIGNKIIRIEERIIENLRNTFGSQIFNDVIAFKNEHSVEFPLLFLSALKEDFYVILSLISKGSVDELRKIAEGIFNSIKPFIDDIFLISSIDLSHVGRKFGDPEIFDTTQVDLKYIEHLKNMENEEAFKFLEENNNFTKIDGIYTNFLFLEILKLMGAKKGEIVDYKIYHEEVTSSIVSYTSIIFK
ncbi:MAG: AmmeMemoRadiSam system protein B [candidate division WOR-3 bacterium]